MKRGSLVVVGTGIQAGHLTREARGWIECSDKVLYCISDAATERLILTLNPNSESLWSFYDEEKPRQETYRQMTERTLECVREGSRVCAVYYGHPGLFVDPSRSSISMARDEGFEARMLPGISSVDCLFCDLDVDPASGCQIFEATDLLLRDRPLDINSHVIILQVSSIGESGYLFNGWPGRHLEKLKYHILKFYPESHPISFYSAPQFPLCDATILRMPISNISVENSERLATLYIPPVDRAPISLEAMRNLELSELLEDIDLIPLE